MRYTFCSNAGWTKQNVTTSETIRLFKVVWKLLEWNDGTWGYLFYRYPIITWNIHSAFNCLQWFIIVIANMQILCDGCTQFMKNKISFDLIDYIGI